MIEDSN